jgi:hypothetical protein
MTFINPIELLSLQDTAVNEIDSGVIRKAKRRVQADIELSDDGHIAYNGSNITKSDAERAINELDDQEKIEFYHFIANNRTLNGFLSRGDEKFFSQFRQESIYKLPSFVNFISPYFTEKYDRALFRAFQNDDEPTFKRIISVPPLVSATDKDKAFKSVSNLIRERIKEVDQTIRDIKNEESSYNEDNIDDAFEWVQEQLNVSIINSLPQYFQSLRNQVANSVRNLSVNIFNAFGKSQLSLDIIGYALEFDIDGLTKQKLTHDYNQIEEINDRHVEEERNAPILKKYAALLIGLKGKLQGIENKTISASSINSWITTSVSVSEINALDDVFDEIRNQLALGLRALSVAVWNSHNDIDVALALINKALSISSNTETRTNLTDARNQLNELKRKLDGLKKEAATRSSQSYSRTTTKSSSSNNQGCLVFLGIAVVIGIIIAIANSNKSSSSYSSPTYSSSSNTTSPDNSTYTEPVVTESQYKGNQLSNGASPLDGCFGKGKYSGQAWIRFDNSNASDAIVCLVKLSTGKTIRNEYIQAGKSFTMNNIPSGTYYLKVYYGNDWNPNKENFCGTLGAFDTHGHFSKSDSPSDYIEVSNTDYSYTTGSITLYSVANGNMSTEATTAAEFFNN